MSGGTSASRFEALGPDLGAAAGLQNVTLQVAEHVAVITLNRPDRLNAISHGPHSMAEDMLAAARIADERDDVRCIVFTGAGRAFSSGGDPGDRVLTTPVEWASFLEDNAREADTLRQLSTPTIGAINGMCYGFGLVLATHMDLLVSVEEAQFGLIETRFGSTGAQTLAFHVGAQWAKFLALTGELISARQAERIGLLLAVLPRDVFEGKVLDLARRIAAMPREGVTVNRRVINAAMDHMGWADQQRSAIWMNTVANLHVAGAATLDGRVLTDIRRDEGWKAYKAARDDPFTPPWLDS